MKNPNGYGTIVKMSGQRRKPYAFIVTAGHEYKDNKKKQIRKTIGYYGTLKEAKKAQVDYLHGMISVEDNKITFSDLYHRFINSKRKDVSKSQMDVYNMAYKACSTLHDITFKDIRNWQLQKILDDSDKSSSYKSKIRTLFSQMYSMALMDDIVVKDYSTHLSVGKETSTNPHRMLTDDEIKAVMEAEGRWPDYLKILLLTGMRMMEVANIKTSDINLEKRFMIGGSKTEAGKSRLIPLHPYLIPVIERNTGTSYLFSDTNKPVPDYTIKKRLSKAKEEMGVTFANHDTRKTFNSVLVGLGVTKVIRQKILGHKGGDVTDKTYTEIELRTALKEIDKLSEHPVFANYLLSTASYPQQFRVISK